jgi:hypothetical protein
VLSCGPGHGDCASGHCRRCAEDLVGGSPEGRATREDLNARVESYGGTPPRAPYDKPVRK